MKVIGIVEARTLFLLNMMRFIYVFVESMIFVVNVMYGYYVLLKRKENACEESLFLNFNKKN